MDLGVPGLRRGISERNIESNASEMAQMKRSLSGSSRKGMTLDSKPEYGPQITGYIANLAKTTSPQVRLDILAKFAQLLKNKFDVNECKPVGDILTP